MTLLLASQSSGRAAMLRAAGLDFETSAAHVDEEALTASLLAAGQTPRNIADALADPDVPRVDDAQDVAAHAVALQQPPAAHDVRVRGRTAAGDPVAVVVLRRAVEAQADEETLGREEAAPRLVEEGAVGLEGVEDPPARRPVPLLERDDPAEVVEPEDGRLAAVPEEIDRPFGGDFDLLADVLLQQIVGHMVMRWLCANPLS